MSFWLRLGACCLALLAACEKENSQYCEGNPDDTVNCPPDAPTACTDDSQCPGQVCDTTSGACVQCTPTKAQACTGTTPVCGSNNMCGACTTHSQCTASNVCLADGSCGNESQIAYVSASGTGTACTKASPCPLLKDAIAKNLPYVKIAADGAMNDSATVTIDGKAVTIFADAGAKIDRTSDGPILEVRSANADVKIYDLRITGATSSSGVGVLMTPNGGTPALTLERVTVDSNQGGGIASSGGTLTIQQSTITSNAGGGITVSGTGTMFSITDNVIVYNGTANGVNATQLGGVAITSNTSGAKFEWNTVAFNQSDGAIYRGGVSCTGAMASAAGNLIYRNSESDGAGGLKTDTTTQRNATGCQFANTLAVTSDASNLGFKSPATQPFDFHLTATSPSTVVDAGGACSGVDFDRQTRPIGAGCDLGADEFKP